jgi:5,10-methylenetetrahydromethanopterin reductase
MDYAGPIGLAFFDRPGATEQLQLAAHAERLGYASAWVGETRLTRDAVSMLGAFAAVTRSIPLGAGVVNPWTRGPVLMALTFATLHELAPGRIMLGLGVYSDPLAADQGIERRQPLAQLQEYVQVVRRILALGEPVTFAGDHIRVHEVSLDLGDGVSREPLGIPIYLGATGEATMKLAGRIADGVLLNGFMSTDYTRRAVAWVRDGARADGRDPSSIACVQLVDTAMSDDRDDAFAIAHHMTTMYLGGQPDIARAAGLDPELQGKLAAAVGGWPPRARDVDAARHLVDRSTVERLVLVGTPQECRARIGDWVQAGATYPVVSPITDDVGAVVNAFAPR